jgi:hypothetical protein
MRGSHLPRRVDPWLRGLGQPRHRVATSFSLAASPTSERDAKMRHPPNWSYAMRWAILWMLCTSMAFGADSDSQTATPKKQAAEWKDRELKKLREEQKTLEDKSSEFKRSRQFVEVNRLEKDIRAVKRQIAGIVKMSDEEAAQRYDAEQQTEREAAELAANKAAERQMAELREQEQRKADVARRQGNTDSPLKILGAMIAFNSIGTPEVMIRVTNDSAKTIEAFKVDAELFNKFDEPVTFAGSDKAFRGIDQETLEVGKTRTCTWNLALRDTAARATLWVSRIKFSDGTEWLQDKELAAKRPGNLVTAKTK